ncbi:Alw26I/Eco31I/Esp3I family type II restriction adenine-specific DNA-methyltransferase [Billgrantia antri]|uniref:Alw26I/Eco31I/Esp3I family type II restriction adenine-specific DNA-methyltransferase n=1 Tax=Billgrantia antri TaxID=2846777 RepID=UPI003B20E288
MKHIQHIKTSGSELPDSFVVKATGRFYTHATVAEQMTRTALSRWSRAVEPNSPIRLIDPFGGDGRLVVAFIRAWIDSGRPNVEWQVTLWDLNEEGLSEAESALISLRDDTGLNISWELIVGDSFYLANQVLGSFDVVISNPPWELLKPDRRELKSLEPVLSESYIQAMREYDTYLTETFPAAQPTRKFAGWGTNLSRVGFDVCRTILAPKGILAVVMPASFMADDLSFALRKEVLEHFAIHEIAYFPAEARLFGSADVSTITMVAEPNRINGVAPTLARFDKEHNVSSRCTMHLSEEFLKETGFVVPVSVDGDALAVLQRLTADLPAWSELEGSGISSLWAGRELDETGIRNWLSVDADGPLFIKGRMISRFTCQEAPSERVVKAGWSSPVSVDFSRIAWRDVSRPSQKRRVIATLIPPGAVAGNSLGVAYFRDNGLTALRALLGVMSSLVFEFQLRSHLATGHVSLSSLRKVRVPSRTQLDLLDDISKEVEKLLAEPSGSQARLEALVAHQAYGLSEQEFHSVVGTFSKLTNDEREEIFREYRKVTTKANPEVKKRAVSTIDAIPGIPNHYSARISELDLRMIQAVPVGGNWKNIPESIPSKRLEQIRESYKRGEGSRSTYYGRLRDDMPSYTISTYFNRPGNGCHIHPSQDRVLSQREAARLQSFPDNFQFVGPQGIVNKQIGNAVPPLLAFQIARQLGTPGVFIDLFSGAGGLGLGFSWAGWQPLLANDIEPKFLETYSLNVHDSVLLGSITDSAVQTSIIERAKDLRARHPEKPFWIIGGPPCQGFSTAGRKRTMEDERNQLFSDYCKVLEILRPDGFVFENVTGLLNMQKGKVFKMVKEAFESVMPNVQGWLLSAEEFAVPQRRKRVFLIGTARPDREIVQPPRLTSCAQNGELFSVNERAISVGEALADLPPIEPSQDGSSLAYATPPQTTYQAFMRGEIGPAEFLDSVRRRSLAWSGS